MHFICLEKVEVMKYFGRKNALAKHLWTVLKNRSNAIRRRRGPPVRISYEYDCLFHKINMLLSIFFHFSCTFYFAEGMVCQLLT